jgi:hypothetical protein
MADGRRRDPEFVGGAREAAMARRRLERPERPQAGELPAHALIFKFSSSI